MTNSESGAVPTNGLPAHLIHPQIARDLNVIPVRERDGCLVVLSWDFIRECESKDDKNAQKLKEWLEFKLGTMIEFAECRDISEFGEDDFPSLLESCYGEEKELEVSYNQPVTAEHCAVMILDSTSGSDEASKIANKMIAHGLRVFVVESLDRALSYIADKSNGLGTIFVDDVFDDGKCDADFAMSRLGIELGNDDTLHIKIDLLSNWRDAALVGALATSGQDQQNGWGR